MADLLLAHDVLVLNLDPSHQIQLNPPTDPSSRKMAPSKEQMLAARNLIGSTIEDFDRHMRGGSGGSHEPQPSSILRVLEQLKEAEQGIDCTSLCPPSIRTQGTVKDVTNESNSRSQENNRITHLALRRQRRHPLQPFA